MGSDYVMSCDIDMTLSDLYIKKYVPSTDIIHWLVKNNRISDIICDIECGGLHPSGGHNELTNLSCKYGRLDLLKYLVSLPSKYGVYISSYSLIIAVHSGNLSLFKYLCELPPKWNINPSIDDNRVIKEAIIYDYFDIFKYIYELSDRCVYVDADVLNIALSNKRYNIAKYILARNSFRIENILSNIYNAMMAGEYELANYMLDMGIKYGNVDIAFADACNKYIRQILNK